jgi:flagellar basal-body rod protein FlgC
MNFLSGISSTASALHAEKQRMEVVAQNIANAHTTKDTNGQAYQRKMLTFEAALDASTGQTGVKVTGMVPDQTPGEEIYNPEHPHADKEGMVHMPNVNVGTEMVDLLSASRAYEANLTVARNARQMASKALSIGR